ncbi:MAG: cysteine desulfurase, partial [Oscillospiraceae bacterium]|nr:cysteine desulfurase [Oscillospiraceae bacterium]
EAADAALNAMLNVYGNPSSTHTKGREAKKLLDLARAQTAAALGCKPGELVYTSCGSESDNWALLSGAQAMQRRGKHIISSAVEHDAIRKSLEELESRGFEVTRLMPDETGRIRTEDVINALRDDTILVSLMLVNNETGAVTDIAGISHALKRAKSQALLHTDAVQAFMKLPFTAKSLGADMISISGHKIHAPKGIGALYIREGLRLKPFIVGGAQEQGRRAGTEALPQIAALGAACEAARRDMAANIARMSGFKTEIIERLAADIPELRYIPTDSPHILSISLPGWRSEVLMNYLEAQEVYVSKSSACKKGGRSHVLEAIGLEPRVIDGALRIGLSRFTTQEDVDALCTGLKAAHDTLAHN